MGLSNVKKELNKLDKSKIIEIISDLYKKHKSVKEYLDFYINPNEKKLLIEFRDKIFYSFYPERGFNFNLNSAKKAITDIKKFSPSPDILADLMLFFVECGVDFSNDFGFESESFYNSLSKTFVDALKLLDSNNCLNRYKERVYSVVSKSENFGWGFGDYMYDVLYDFYPDIDNEN